MKTLSKAQLEFLHKSLRDVPDFPKPGIVFKDITTLLANAEAFEMLMSHLESRYKSYDLDCVVGIESRGFIFGAALASRLGIGFVPVRKPGKLPSTTIAEKYSLEYGTDEVHIHLDAFEGKKDARALLIDDLIATGGTACAAARLVKKAGAHLVETAFIIELSFLHGKKKLLSETEVYSVLTVE